MLFWFLFVCIYVLFFDNKCIAGKVRFWEIYEHIRCFRGKKNIRKSW